MAAASIRACFVTLRPQHGGELPAELRFSPELQLQLLGAEARGGLLGQEPGDALTLRRERSGVYCTAATGELSFQAEGASAELPFRLLLDKKVLSEGELVWAESEPPRLALRSAGAPTPTADEDAVDLELVVLVTNAGGQPTAVAASLTLATPVTAPAQPLPGAFLRTSSGRSPSTLEPIDEDRGVRHAAGSARPFRRVALLPAACPNREVTLTNSMNQVALPLPRRSIAGQPFLGADWAPPSAPDEHELRFFSSGNGGGESDAELMDDPGAELTWFSAGLRVGMGVGLGVCLGVGLGAGILISSYQRATRRLGALKDGMFK